MILPTLSFLAGLLLVQQYCVLPGRVWLVIGMGAVGFIVWRRYWLCLFFSVGLLWGLVFASLRLADQLPKHLENTFVLVTGYIASLPEHNEKYIRFNFNITDAKQAVPKTVRLSWYNVTHDVKAGQYWSFSVKLKRAHGTLNPGGFDYERWLFTEGIGATGYVRNQPKPLLLKQNSMWQIVLVCRQIIVDGLEHALVDSKSLALIKALTLGDGNSISQTEWDIFRKTGTTHLFVISGSHIGFIAGLVYLLVLKLWAKTGLLRWSPQKVSASVALIAAVIYSALAGFTVPTQRAMIMFAIAMTAVILQRNQRSFNTLSIAMLLVLMVDPLAVLSIGFWLSFLAVALIVYSLAGRLVLPGYRVSTLKINWATSLGLAPLLLVFFQQVSLISPVANFIAVPVIEFLIVPIALLATVLLPICSHLAMALFWAIDKTLQALIWILIQLADLPMSTWSHTAPPLWSLVFAVPAVLLLLAPLGVVARGLGIIMLLPLMFTKTEQLKRGAFTITVLDVGQGLAVTVRTAHHWLVYDAGPKYNLGSDSGQTVLLPFLRYQQANSINTLLISHGDNDHIGGAQSLMNNMVIDQIITSVPELFTGYQATRCVAGQFWRWDDVTFTVLAPDDLFESKNDNSCVLRIASSQGSVLLTGDIEARAEQQLITVYGTALKADVLLAPHHGSKTSSTLAFLQVVNPDTIIIPAGYLNQFGHPHAQVLARYDAIKASVFNTASSGAVTITSNDNGLRISTYRDTDGKYWNNKTAK